MANLTSTIVYGNLDVKKYATIEKNLLVNGNISVGGNINATSITGNLNGKASSAGTADTATTATTAAGYTSNGAIKEALDSKLPLSGGTMTGAIVRIYSTASNEPVLKIGSNNHDIQIFKVYSSDNTYSDTGSIYGYNLKYLGTGSDVANLLTLNCDNITGTAVTGWSLNQSGQMGVGTTPNTSYRLNVDGNTKITGTLTVSSTITGNVSGTVTNLAGGAAGKIPYQTKANTTSFLDSPAANKVLVATTASTPTWGTVTNDMLAGSISKDKLADNDITLGTTIISLGGSSSAIKSMTNVSSKKLSLCVDGATENADKIEKAYMTYNSSTESIDFAFV